MTKSFNEPPRQDLSEEDRAFLDSIDERGMYAQIADTFSGPMRGWTGFAFVLSLVFFGACVYILVRLAGAPPIDEALLWLAGFILAALGVAMIKMWFWMRMNQVTLLRELKKIELRVDQLSRR